jgi:hypothetical protein
MLHIVDIKSSELMPSKCKRMAAHSDFFSPERLISKSTSHLVIYRHRWAISASIAHVVRVDTALRVLGELDLPTGDR